MIYSIIILILSLLLFPVHSFYIINAAVVEQCATGTSLYLNKFDSNKMRCLNKPWRRVLINLQYHCINNLIIRKWTMQTNVSGSSPWPRDISVLSNKDFKAFGTFGNKEPLIIEENPVSFDSNNNQFITYIWTELSNGPQCRIKFTIIKDICTTQKGQKIGAKFTDAVCYHGIQRLNLTNPQHRNDLNKLIDDSIKAVSITPQKTSTSNNNLQTNPSIDNNSQKDPNLSALNATKPTFLKKNKLYIFLGGGIGVVIIVVAIIFIITRHRPSPDQNLEPRMSVESDME